MNNLQEMIKGSLIWILQMPLFVNQARNKSLAKKKGKNDDVLSDLVGEIHEHVTAFKEANKEIKRISTYLMR